MTTVLLIMVITIVQVSRVHCTLAAPGRSMSKKTEREDLTVRTSVCTDNGGVGHSDHFTNACTECLV